MRALTAATTATGFFTPANDPAAAPLVRLRLAGAWTDAVGTPVLPFVLVAATAEARRPALPQPEPLSVDFPNDHLGYAITWYGLAAALVAVYIVLQLQQAGASPP